MFVRVSIIAVCAALLGCPPAPGGRTNGSPTKDVVAATDADPAPADAATPGDVPTPPADGAGNPFSCEARCDQPHDPAGKCSCDQGCIARENCCFDYAPLCKPGLLTCEGRCGEAHDPKLQCQCSDVCGGEGGNCCGDWAALCEGEVAKCAGKCGQAFDIALPCQCTPDCDQFGNCCDDWAAECQPGWLTCENRCGEDYDKALPCQCNITCAKHGSCCDDFLDRCDKDINLDWVYAPAGKCKTAAEWHFITFISDGDTFTTADGDKVRLVAVDTPEVTDFECHAAKATDYTMAKLKGESVCLLPDPSQPDEDEFGRKLRNAFYNEPALDGAVVMHDARLVRLGLARVHYKFIWGTSHDEQTVLMELKAKEEGAGGWGACGWE